MTRPKETNEQRKARETEDTRVYQEFITGGYPRAGRKKRVKLTQADKDRMGVDSDYMYLMQVDWGPDGKPYTIGIGTSRSGGHGLPADQTRP